MSACVNISDTVDVLSHTIPCRVYREWADMRKHPVSDSCLGENTLLISEENGQITSSSWEGNSNSKKPHSLQTSYAEEHLWEPHLSVKNRKLRHS